ncbi:MAG: hypothetical protein AAGU06_00340 [Candidatus Shapirobacteria bacterium]
MKGWKLFLSVVLSIFLSIFVFIFFEQYKLVRIKLASGKLIGLWSTNQLLLNKDVETILRKFGTNLQEKKRRIKISFVNKNETGVQFSNSGIQYKCLNEAKYNHIYIFIDGNKINNKNMASNLYYISLKCSLFDLNQNIQDGENLMNYLMQASSNKNIFKSFFIPLSR